MTLGNTPETPASIGTGTSEFSELAQRIRAPG